MFLNFLKTLRGVLPNNAADAILKEDSLREKHAMEEQEYGETENSAESSDAGGTGGSAANDAAEKDAVSCFLDHRDNACGDGCRIGGCFFV